MSKKIYALGFNAFDQFATTIFTPLELTSECSDKNVTNIGGSFEKSVVHEWLSTVPLPTQISISWDCISFITTDGALKLSGFHANTLDTKEKYVDVACTTRHIATVSRSGVGTLFAWSALDGYGDDVPNKIYEFHPSTDSVKMIGCYVGEQDAVFLSEAGRAIWLSLRDQLVEAQILLIGGKVTHVSCGKQHVLLLVADPCMVYSFGHGSHGQLGHGVLISESDPRLVECMEGIGIVALEAGGWHSAAVSAEGDLYTWGWNESGQLGFPVKSDTGPSPLSNGEVVTVQATPKCVEFHNEVIVASVACGSRHTVILTSDHNLWTFGWNAHGQLGFVEPLMTGRPTDVSSLFPNCCDIRCGGWNTIVKADYLHRFHSRVTFNGTRQIKTTMRQGTAISKKEILGSIKKDLKFKC